MGLSMDVDLALALFGAAVALVAVALLHRREGAARRAVRLLGRGKAPGGGGPAVRLRGAARQFAAAAPERATRWLRGRSGLRAGPELLCLPLGVLLAFAARSLLPVPAGAAAVPVARRWLRQRRLRAACEAREDAVARMCAALAGELRAGRPPEEVLTEAVERLRSSPAGTGWTALTALLAAARFGGDVPYALRDAAGTLGGEGLASVAACWEVCLDGGAGMADGLDRVAGCLRAERSRRDDLRAQLAGPRATAGMLALLPAFGVLLGMALGADPLRVLFHTPVGLTCLFAGVLLEWAGLAWTARIVRSAEVAS